MKNNLVLYFLFLVLNAAGQGPSIVWDKTFGGSGDDGLHFSLPLSDGGLLFCGTSFSPVSGNKTSLNKGGSDYWLVKLDSNGIKVWEKSYGGSLDDGVFTCLVETADGGFLLGGASKSGISGDRTCPLKSFRDYWILKLDVNGNKIWDKSYGTSTGSVSLRQILKTNDGNYLLCGEGNGSGGDMTEPPYGNDDVWLLKIDTLGNKLWDKRLGAPSGYEYVRSVVETSTGNFLVGASSSSAPGGNKTAPNYSNSGNHDYWIVMIDSTGNVLWDKSFGGTYGEGLVSIVKTHDKCFLLAGHSNSSNTGNKTTYNPGLNYNFWIVKVDSLGNKLWEKEAGTSSAEFLSSAFQLNDKGFLLAGSSSTNNDKKEYWVVKTDSLGNKQWEKMIGGSNDETLVSCGMLKNGFVLSGSSLSGISKNKTEINYGVADAWVVKLCIPPSSVITPSGDTTFCLGDSITLSAPVGATSYLWSTGATSQSIVVKAAGSYFVTVTDPYGCPGTSIPMSIKVHYPPQITAGGPLVFCSGNSVLLSASDGFSYNWSTGATTQSISVTATGTYSVTVKSACGTLAAGPVSVTVNPLPSATISPSGPQRICSGSSLLLTASAGTSYLWSTGESTSAISVSSEGNYKVTVTNSFGCTKLSGSTNLQFDYPAFIDITGDTAMCAGQTAILYGNPSSSNYLWSNGMTSPALVLTQGGTFSVTLTNKCGTTTSSPVTIKFYNYPNVYITANNPVCTGESVQLLANGAMTYNWIQGVSSTSALVYDNPVSSKKYVVRGFNGPCAKTDTFDLQVDPLPVAGFTYVIYGAKVTFTNTSSYSQNYKWDFGDGASSLMNNPEHMYADDSIRTYTVTLVSTSSNCGSDTITHTFKAGLDEVSTFAGSGFGTINGPPNLAKFHDPRGIAFCSKTKNLYLIDYPSSLGWTGKIRRIDSLGNVFDYYVDGTTNSHTGAIAVDNKGRVYVATSGWVYYIDTVLKNGVPYFIPNPGDFSLITGMSFDNAGNLYISDADLRMIKKVDPQGNITVVTGMNSNGIINDGPSFLASFAYIQDIFMDTINNCLYIIDGQTVRKLSFNDNMVSTLAGSASTPGYLDGPGSIAKFWSMSAICGDKYGNIYVSEQTNCVIRKIAPDGTVTTRAGTQPYGYIDGPAATSKFYAPLGMTIDDRGNLFVSDQNMVIRKIRSKYTVSQVSVPEQKNETALLNVYPNPFNSEATISYWLEKDADISLDVYNALGQKIHILHQGKQPQGLHSFVFSSPDKNNGDGFYFIFLRVEDKVYSKKLIQVE